MKFRRSSAWRHFDTTTTPAGVNYYAAPGYVVNNYAVSTTPAGSNMAQGATVTTVMADENGMFTRAYMNDGASFMLGNAALNSSYTENGAQWTLNGGSGRYAVIKIRANDVKAIRFGIKTDKGEVVAGGWANNWRTNADEFTDGEFTTYVIDLGEANVKSDATVVGIMMGTGRSAIGTYAAGGSLDIAYFALCDDWAEVASVVGTDDVLLTTWGNGTDGLGNGSSTDTPMTNDEVQANIAE